MAQDLSLMEDAYKVHITVSDELAGSEVPAYWVDRMTALIPEDGFTLETSSSFSAPLSLGAGSLNNISQAFTGQSLHVNEMGKNFWDKAEPIEMSLGLTFTTWSDPYEDVVKPSLTMLSLPLPAKKSDNTAIPPVAVDQQGNLGAGIVVDIGPMGKFPVLPTGSSVNFSGTLCESPNDDRNWPVASEVDFSFKVSQKPTKGSIGSKLLGNG